MVSHWKKSRFHFQSLIFTNDISLLTMVKSPNNGPISNQGFWTFADHHQQLYIVVNIVIIGNRIIIIIKKGY